MVSKQKTLWFLWLAFALPLVAASPLSEEELLALVEKGVDTDLIVRLVERDCVAFEVDARAVLRLSESVPKAVLHAALDCLEKVEPEMSEKAEAEAAETVEPEVVEQIAPKVADRRGAAAEPTTTKRPAVAPPKPPEKQPGPPARAEAARPSTPATPPSTPAPQLPERATMGEPLTLDAITRVVLVPFAINGKTNDTLTDALRQAVEKGGTRFTLEDSHTVAAHFDEKRTFNSGAKVKSLLKAARSAGVEALLVGNASGSILIGNHTVRLQAKLIEVASGEVLWKGSGSSEAPGLSWDEALTRAAESTARRLP